AGGRARRHGRQGSGRHAGVRVRLGQRGGGGGAPGVGGRGLATREVGGARGWAQEAQRVRDGQGLAPPGARLHRHLPDERGCGGDRGPAVSRDPHARPDLQGDRVVTGVLAAEPLIRWSWIRDHLVLIGAKVGQHVWLTALAVTIGFCISLPVAIYPHRHRRVYAPMTFVAGLLYTIPSLALFVLLLPFTGLTTLTSEIGLVSY